MNIGNSCWGKTNLDVGLNCTTLRTNLTGLSRRKLLFNQRSRHLYNGEKSFAVPLLCSNHENTASTTRHQGNRNVNVIEGYCAVGATRKLKLRTQNSVGASLWEFKSRLRHQIHSRIGRKWSHHRKRYPVGGVRDLRSVYSGLDSAVPGSVKGAISRVMAQ